MRILSVVAAGLAIHASAFADAEELSIFHTIAIDAPAVRSSSGAGALSGLLTGLTIHRLARTTRRRWISSMAPTKADSTT